MTKLPTFFLSSTIYDFRDLRGAIKFFLESRGCRVLASEFNDFGGDLNRHSYEACLANIEQADCFILLVGERVGGWYDKPNRISITQQEYRFAYERHKQGLIKIVTLVRAEVWQLREDRHALDQHLSRLEINQSERKSIRNFPSKFANDADFISDFLKEIGRNAETGRAVQTGGTKPTGNWIYVFNNFRDVHDVLSPLSFSGQTANEAAYTKALQQELLTVLARLLIKHNEKPLDFSKSLRKHIQRFPIEKECRLDNIFPMDNEDWQKFSTIMLHALGVKFNIVVIEDALTSTLFLDYDASQGIYVQNSAYEGLARLVEEIRMYNAGATADTFSLVIEYSPKRIGCPHGEIHLPTQRLAQLYAWRRDGSISLASPQPSSGIWKTSLLKCRN